MKIYTRTGDDGTTGLIGGARVPKHDARLDAYGTVDELNATLGLAAVSAGDDLRAGLAAVQTDLFVIGSHLAAPAGDETARKYLPALDDGLAERLEREIDSAEETLPKLTNFILPGGTETAARLHVARAVCRRAERLTIAMPEKADAQPAIERYLNRLSDWLFVMARRANHVVGVADVPWKPVRG